jgi:hypothetical protein
MRRRWKSPHGLRGSFSRKMIFNFGAAMRGQHTSHRETLMPHAIIRGNNGRRHEVDFGEASIRVEIYASDETVEIFVEADFETHAEERRRFAILNVPRNLFSEASGAAARRSSTSSLKNRVVR